MSNTLYIVNITALMYTYVCVCVLTPAMSRVKQSHNV